MPLRKGLPVKIPSCSSGAEEIVWDQLLSSSATHLDLQTSSSRLHRFSSQIPCEDPGDRSLPSGHTTGELVSMRPSPQILTGLEGFWVPSPPQPMGHLDYLHFRRGVMMAQAIFHDLEEMGQVCPDIPILFPHRKPPLLWM